MNDFETVRKGLEAAGLNGMAGAHALDRIEAEVERLRAALEWQRAEATRQADNLPPEWNGTIKQGLRALAESARAALAKDGNNG